MYHSAVTLKQTCIWITQCSEAFSVVLGINRYYFPIQNW